MTSPDLAGRVAMARGDEPVDLLLRNAQLVNVHTAEIYRTDIAIADSVVVGFGPREAHRTLDLESRYVCPGLIDAHVHVESALVPPSEFARAVVPRGVTTVVSDPHEIANVHGLAGIRFMLDDAKDSPLSMFVNASSCVPATHMGTAGAELTAEDLAGLRAQPMVLGLAEVMNFPGVVAGDAGVLGKIRSFADRVVDGHCPGLAGPALDAYVSTGISSDHESTTVEEAREKLRRGMALYLREATNARNLRDLLPLVTPATERRLCLCTDDRQPADLLDSGSIDDMVRIAIANGVPPITALRMATLNTAEHFGLRDRGALAPGRRADLFVFEDLERPHAQAVYIAGVLVAEGGRMLQARRSPQAAGLGHSVRVDWSAIDLRIPAGGTRARVIEVIPDQILTGRRLLEPRVRQGEAIADPARDMLKMAVIERHGRSGSVGLGFVTGLGLRQGAIAGTVAHDHHNLVVIGADDDSMLAAARAVAGPGGGLAAALGQRILALLPLPIAGLMSDLPIEVVREHLTGLTAAARQLGTRLHDPFMAMSFLALEVIPKLKLTDRGLVDVESFGFVPLFTDEPALDPPAAP